MSIRLGRVALIAALGYVTSTASSVSAAPLTPGNILVSGHLPTGPLVREYTRSGTLVQQWDVPYPGTDSSERQAVRDLVADKSGDIHVFHGTFAPYLSSCDTPAGTWQQRTEAGWRIVNNGTFGGIACHGNSVFVGDMGSAAGNLIRFDTVTGATERFGTSEAYIDLTLGQDGLLYGLIGAGSPSGKSIVVYNPDTLAFVRRLDFSTQFVYFEAGVIRSLAVNAQGEIFLNQLYGPLYRLSPSGMVLQTWDFPVNSYVQDIDLSSDGLLMITQSNGLVIFTDQAFSSYRAIRTIDYYAAGAFGTFIPVPEPGSLLLLSIGCAAYRRLCRHRSR